MYEYILIVLAYLILQMCFMWVLYYQSNNPSIVDVSWSIGIMIAGLIYLSQNFYNPRIMFISSLLIIWALRLAGYLWNTRVRKKHVDERYIELSKNWKISKSLGFFLNFQLQAFFILIISIAFFFAVQNTSETLFVTDYIAAVLVIIGIIAESIADYQLYYFKKSHKDKICDIGLWHYSRHPNYFFELTIWIGFSLFGLHTKFGCLSFLSPLWLYIIFTKMTIPITEKGSIKAKGDLYLKYQQKTNMLFPWVGKISFHKLR